MVLVGYILRGNQLIGMGFCCAEHVRCTPVLHQKSAALVQGMGPMGHRTRAKKSFGKAMEADLQGLAAEGQGGTGTAGGPALHRAGLRARWAAATAVQGASRARAQDDPV